jgi:type II secretory pathway pseudopilin PulG
MRSEKGYSLLEVFIAIALMGLVSVTFLGAIYTASKAVSIADERAAAESLARTEMEYIRSQLYSAAPWDYTVTSSERSATTPPSWYDDTNNPPSNPANNPPLLDSSYDGYSVSARAGGLLDPGIDNEIQKITVTVTRQGGSDIVTLEDYRSMR